MFQLTALIVRGPVISAEKFFISVDRVLFSETEVRGASLRVQDFVRSTNFTQVNFFPESGIAMLTDSAAIFDRISTSAV